jgi:hypothetical protein
MTRHETLPREKDSQRSIQHFYASFDRDHLGEVNKVVKYLRENKWEVDEVIVQIPQIVRGETHAGHCPCQRKAGGWMGIDAASKLGRS